jgi:hypothetical protein
LYLYIRSADKDEEYEEENIEDQRFINDEEDEEGLFYVINHIILMRWRWQWQQ